jgi:hypothetical protein
MMTAIMVPMFAMMSSILLFIFLKITGLDAVVESNIDPFIFEVLSALIGPVLLLSIGSIFVISGIRSLSSPDA